MMEGTQSMERPHGGQARTAVASAPKAANLTTDKRYPVLFAPGEVPARPGYSRKVRPGTHLIVVTALHEALSAAEIEAIAQYRLVQYTLAGLYDAEVVTRLQLKTDPAIGTLSGQDIHVLVGDTSGRFLCYLCFQSPLAPPPPWLSSVPAWIAETAGTPPDYPLVQHTNRPYFPVESEYGPMIYSQHPGLARLPIAGIRELTRLVRNQLTRTPVDALAVVEAILAVSEAMRDPSYRIEAIVGCASFEVRRLLWTLGIRMAYAPLAPIQGDNVSGQIPGAELLWTEEAHLPGRFWPIAITTPDVSADADEFARLDAALALLDVAEVGARVKQLRREGPRAQPRLIVPPEKAGGILWTADAFYPIELSDPGEATAERLKRA